MGIGRRLLYQPKVNTALRTVLRPFARVIPAHMRFPIAEPFVLEVAPGIRIRIHSNETSYVSKVLFWEGVAGYEYHLVPLFLNIAREADIVIDVGANLGYYSLLAAAVNPRATVVAFEPSPAAFHFLQLNLRENGFDHVRAERIAISDHDGSITFIEARNPKFPHVTHHLTGASGIEDPGTGYVHNRPFDVPARTLDSYVYENLSGRVDLLKIDAEASEHLVLRGGERILHDDRPVIFCEALVGRIETEMEAIFAEYGYALYNARPGDLRRVDRILGENLTSHDFVMVPRERVEEFEARWRR